MPASGWVVSKDDLISLAYGALNQCGEYKASLEP